jgi:hypothetical protein
MTKELDFDIEDLGTASVETKGGPIGVGEPAQKLDQLGISDVD